MPFSIGRLLTPKKKLGVRLDSVWAALVAANNYKKLIDFKICIPPN